MPIILNVIKDDLRVKRSNQRKTFPLLNREKVFLFYKMNYYSEQCSNGFRKVFEGWCEVKINNLRLYLSESLILYDCGTLMLGVGLLSGDRKDMTL